VRTTIVKESLAKKGSQSEFQGYLTNQSVIGKPRRFWAVANGMLAQYRNYADFSPIESFDLLLFTVKVSEKVFSLFVHSSRMSLMTRLLFVWFRRAKIWFLELEAPPKRLNG
jgi:hypothetical protein